MIMSEAQPLTNIALQTDSGLTWALPGELMRKAHDLKCHVSTGTTVSQSPSVTFPFGLCTICYMWTLSLLSLSLYLKVKSNSSVQNVQSPHGFVTVSSLLPLVALPPGCPEVASPPLCSTQWTTEVTAGWPTHRPARCICFQRRASGWERLTSQDTLTMTGCRCPKLAGRESNFKDHCVSTHTHPIFNQQQVYLTGVWRGTVAAVFVCQYFALWIRHVLTARHKSDSNINF